MNDWRVAGRGWQVAVLVMVTACGVSTPPSRDPRPATRDQRILLPDGYAVHVEIAADDATRQQGLMYRDQLGLDRGMIFFFPRTDEYPFWMKNTLIPLDMVWIDEQKRIVHVAANVPPCKADPCPSYAPGALSRYVLELASGVAGRHGLANGQTLRFEGLDNVIVR